MSLMASERSGRLVYAAMHSGPISTPQREVGIFLHEIPAVYVLPTPGLPCSKKILPSPFPATKSAAQGLCAG